VEEDWGEACPARQGSTKGGEEMRDKIILAGAAIVFFAATISLWVIAVTGGFYSP